MDASNVPEVRNSMEVMLVHEAFVGIDFGVGDCPESFGVEGERKSADACEEVKV
jgi:hypothetical protein